MRSPRDRSARTNGTEKPSIPSVEHTATAADRASASSAPTLNVERLRGWEDITEVYRGLQCTTIQRAVFTDGSALQQHADRQSSDASRCRAGGRGATQTSQERPRR